MVKTRRADQLSYATSKYARNNSRARRTRFESPDKDDEDFEANLSQWPRSARRHLRRKCRPNERPRSSRSLHLISDDTDSEGDGSDVSLFHSRSCATKSSRHAGERAMHQVSADHAGTSNGHLETSIEDDLPRQEDDGAVRRSTRQRKPIHDAIWIMGDHRLSNYSSYKDGNIESSGGKKIIAHENRRAEHRNRNKSQQQLSQTISDSSPIQRSHRSHRKVDVKVEKMESEIDDDEGNDNGKEEQDEKKSDEGEGDQPNASASSGDDEDGSNDDDRKKRRICTRSRRNTESDHNKLDDAFPDMYSRVKRVRSQTKRFAYSPGHRMISRTRSSSDSDESDDSDSDVTGKRRTRENTRANTRKYQLRAHKPTVERFQSQHEPARRSQRSIQNALCNSVLRQLGRRSTNRYAEDDSSSSSDSQARFDHKKPHSRHSFHAKDGAKVADHHSLHSKDGKPATLADIDPMALDTSIRFEHVGGLEEHIRCLQEMVVFPMLYKDVFEKFSITPPKGVLFHGPPGTGKTLIARALANECSQGDRKVAFFMRKGADCLSKWVGESERQLRLLFEQAFQKKPSIIFFDEIDGLAPVRSSKQDQIHASIVSTLLALMDGLDNRGEVIVIGATNRIDAIDPALRRPGRFDRELYFPLPASKERQEILRIHVSQWEKKPEPSLLNELAEQSSGYCGSDLRALCAESVIQALRRTYPQIYKSSQKLLLDVDKVQVHSGDFALALSSIIPASYRVSPSPARKLPSFMEPLLCSTLDKIISLLKEVFPHGLSRDIPLKACIHRPRLLLEGGCHEQAQTSYLAPAVLHFMEHIPVFTLDLGTLYEVSARSPEETVSQVFQEARRNPPSAIFLPGLGQWWTLVPTTVQAVFLMQLQKLELRCPVLLLATSDSDHSILPQEVRNLFSRYRNEVFTLTDPEAADREAFFRPLLLKRALAAPDPPKLTEENWDDLPLAPPPEPEKLTEDQLANMYEKEEHVLRELRIFLREVCAKIARNRLFFMFTKPVDVLEAPDYYEIIEQPMDLETMMTKIDQHHYVCAQEFLNDIDLICRNALEYNPVSATADKLIRHRACFLRDTAYALIKAEMDSDFEERCRAISRDRKKRKGSPSRYAPAPDFVHVAPPPTNNRGAALNGEKEGSARVLNGDLSSHSSMASNSSAIPNGASLPTPARKRRPTGGWSKGIIPKKKKKKKSLSEPEPTSEKPGSPDRSAKVSDNQSPPASPPSPSLSHGRQPVAKGDDSHYSSMNGTLDHSMSDEEMKAERSDGEGNIGLKWYTSAERSSFCEDKWHESQNGTSEKRSGSIDSNNARAADNPFSLEVPRREVVIEYNKLERLLSHAVSLTAACAVDIILELYIRLEKVIMKSQDQWDRSSLIEVLEEELQRFSDYLDQNAAA